MAGYEGLYKPLPGNKETFGGKLKRMAQQGQAAPKAERSRWLRNRYMYRGNQWVQVNPADNRLRVLSATSGGKSRRRETVNRSRQMIDGHVAVLSSSKPPFEVLPPNREQESLDAARFAGKFVDAMWGGDGWKIDRVRRNLCRGGAVDGIQWLSVTFDKYKGGKPVSITVRNPTEEHPEAAPVTDRAELEALREQDPNGMVLWREEKIMAGEVCFDVLPPGRVYVDPFAGNNFDDARWVIISHVWPRDKVERMAGKSIKDMIRNSQSAQGSPAWSDPKPEDVSAEDADGKSQRLSSSEAVAVFELFALPHGDFPKGAHCLWINQAADDPFIVEAWEEDDDLPVRPYTPRPDHGNLVASQGYMDDLAPLQMYLNRLVTLVREWMDKLGRVPVLMPVGSLRDGELYNAKGFAEYHPTGAPHFFPTPGEPAAILTNHIPWVLEQMSEVMSLSNAARGFSPGQGVTTVSAINTLIQQTEEQMGTVEAELRGVLEWGVSRGLKLTEKNYVLPRLVDAPGVDDAVEFDAFVGKKLRGCNTFKITGPLTPKSRAAQIQTLMQLIPMVGGDIRPWVAKIIDGDLDEFMAHEEGQAQRQKRENKKIAALGMAQARDRIWMDFQQAGQAYADVLNEQAAKPELSADGVTFEDPATTLAKQGIVAPNATQMCKQAGLDVPEVDEQDNDPIHILRLDDWRVTPGFEKSHPLVHQVAREHGIAHKTKMSSQQNAMAQMLAPPPGQQGSGGASPPAEKGTPSQPKKPGTDQSLVGMGM